MRVEPRRATGRAVSFSSRASRAASRSGPSVGTSTSRPSTLLTTLLVMTSTSPSASHGAAATMSAARSSPGRVSPIPVTARISSVIRPYLQRPAANSRSASLRDSCRPPPGRYARSRRWPCRLSSIVDSPLWSPRVRSPRRRRCRPASRRARHPRTARRRGRRRRRRCTPPRGPSDTGRRLRVLGAHEDEPARRQARLVPDPPFLEVDGPRAAVVVDHHVRLDPVVGGRQQAYARLPARAQCLGDGRQRVPVAEHAGAYQMGGDVPVAQAEPGRLRAIGGQLLLDRPGLAGPSPAPLGIGAAAQGVHDAVEVRTDPQAVQGHVIPDVDDRGDLGAVVPRHLPHAAQKPGAADPTGEYHDVHTVILAYRREGAALAGPARLGCHGRPRLTRPGPSNLGGAVTTQATDSTGSARTPWCCSSRSPTCSSSSTAGRNSSVRGPALRPNASWVSPRSRCPCWRSCSPRTSSRWSSRPR